jgi:predicted dehydrogenase
MPSPKLTRRAFAASAATLTAASYARAAGANDRVRLGFIGVGNRGDQLIDAFLPHKDCEITAVCDVYAPYLPAANAKAGGKAEELKDYRKLLDLKTVDAAVIGTPDHWHALQFVDACKAGKDVYVEKPLSLTIGEGRRMCQAAAETNRITQVGLHRRSTPYVMELVKLIRSGAIGKVTLAKSYMHRNESPMGIGNPADGDPPEGLDWDLWLGPAPKVPFNRNRALYKFRWFSPYSGGQLTNMGTHYLDVIQWALGQDAPKGVACLGGKFAVADNRDIPDTLEAVWEYDGCLATFTQVNANGAGANARGWNLEFRGTLGTLLVSEANQGFEILPEGVRLEELPARGPLDRAGQSRQERAVKKGGPAKQVPGVSDTADHARNFLDAVKSRKPANCPVETGHRSTTATLLAKLALERRRYLEWDAAAERVTNDEAANRRLSYAYREPWKLG